MVDFSNISPGRADARAIYQMHLDLLSKALVAGEFERFMSRLQLPHRLTTESEARVFRTMEEAAETFDAIHRTLQQQGVTDYVRIVTKADYTDETTIIGEHETHFLRGGQRLLPPYPSRLILKKIDGLWKETEAANAIQHNTWPILMPTVSDTPRIPGRKQ